MGQSRKNRAASHLARKRAKHQLKQAKKSSKNRPAWLRENSFLCNFIDILAFVAAAFLAVILSRLDFRYMEPIAVIHYFFYLASLSLVMSALVGCILAAVFGEDMSLKEISEIGTNLLFCMLGIGSFHIFIGFVGEGDSSLFIPSLISIGGETLTKGVFLYMGYCGLGLLYKLILPPCLKRCFGPSLVIPGKKQ